MDRPPAVDAALLQSMERFLPEGVVGAAALPDKILGLFPHGHTVGGTAALDDGEVLLLYRTAHLVLGGQQHGADQGQAPAVQLGDRGKTANAALPPEVHVKGLNSIIEVVAQRHFIAAKLLRRRVQRAPAQPGAEGTGVLFLPVFKHDGANLGAAHLVGNPIPGEQRRQRAVIHSLVVKLRVKGDGHDLIIKAEVPAQLGQPDGQGHAVLATRNAHHDLITGGDHLVILHGLAHQAAEPLHGVWIAHVRLTLSTRLTISLMEASLVRPET